MLLSNRREDLASARRAELSRKTTWVPNTASPQNLLAPTPILADLAGIKLTGFSPLHGAACAARNWNGRPRLPWGPIPAEVALSFIWIIIIGFLAGVIARLLSAGPNNPTGFLLTTIFALSSSRSLIETPL